MQANSSIIFCLRPMISHIKSKWNKERREREKVEAEGETPSGGRARARSVKAEPRSRRT